MSGHVEYKPKTPIAARLSDTSSHARHFYAMTHSVTRPDVEGPSCARAARLFDNHRCLTTEPIRHLQVMLDSHKHLDSVLPSKQETTSINRFVSAETKDTISLQGLREPLSVDPVEGAEFDVFYGVTDPKASVVCFPQPTHYNPVTLVLDAALRSRKFSDSSVVVEGHVWDSFFGTPTGQLSCVGNANTAHYCD